MTRPFGHPESPNFPLPEEVVVTDLKTTPIADLIDYEAHKAELMAQIGSVEGEQNA